jgi:hypothetical protein
MMKILLVGGLVVVGLILGILIGSCVCNNRICSDCNQDTRCTQPQMARVNSQDFSSSAIYEEVGIFGNVRVIFTNGVPDHPIGIFPVYADKLGCGRPDELVIPAAATYNYLPVNPTPKPTMTWDVVPNSFGIAVNGVPLDPLANECWPSNPCTSTDPRSSTAWLKNAPLHPDMAPDLDDNMAHIQPPPPGKTETIYHYHALPTGLYERLGGSYPWNFSGTPTVTNVTPIQLGWGWDGVPVYGPTCYQTPPAPGAANWHPPKSDWKLKPILPSQSDCRPSTGPPGKYNGDYHYDYYFAYSAATGYPADYLDECNGHTAPVSANGTAFYHYHITEEYPYIPRCWKYTPYYGADQGTLEKEARAAGFTPSPTPTSTPRQTPTPRPPPIS